MQRTQFGTPSQNPSAMPMQVSYKETGDVEPEHLPDGKAFQFMHKCHPSLADELCSSGRREAQQSWIETVLVAMPGSSRNRSMIGEALRQFERSDVGVNPTSEQASRLLFARLGEEQLSGSSDSRRSAGSQESTGKTRRLPG